MHPCNTKVLTCQFPNKHKRLRGPTARFCLSHNKNFKKASKLQSPDNKKNYEEGKNTDAFLFVFFLFLRLRSTLHTKRNALFSHSWVQLASATSALYQTHQSPLSQRTHTHTHAHTSRYAQGNVYIHHKAKKGKASLSVRVSFVCKMKAHSQNADERPTQLDPLAATCSTNAVFGQLKKHQKGIHTRRTLKALTVFHFERASEQRKREIVLWA